MVGTTGVKCYLPVAVSHARIGRTVGQRWSVPRQTCPLSEGTRPAQKPGIDPVFCVTFSERGSGVAGTSEGTKQKFSKLLLHYPNGFVHVDAKCFQEALSSNSNICQRVCCGGGSGNNLDKHLGNRLDDIPDMALKKATRLFVKVYVVTAHTYTHQKQRDTHIHTHPQNHGHAYSVHIYCTNAHTNAR